MLSDKRKAEMFKRNRERHEYEQRAIRSYPVLLEALHRLMIAVHRVRVGDSVNGSVMNDAMECARCAIVNAEEETL